MFSVLPMITLIRYGGCKVELAVPLILSLSKDGVRGGLPGGEIWFDRLTMSGLLMSVLLTSGLQVVDHSAHPELVEGWPERGVAGRERWFDKLTMSGLLMGGLLMSGLRIVNRSVGGLLTVPLILSLSKDGLREELSGRERWFDKLTMSGFCSWRRLGAGPNS